MSWADWQLEMSKAWEGREKSFVYFSFIQHKIVCSLEMIDFSWFDTIISIKDLYL